MPITTIKKALKFKCIRTWREPRYGVNYKKNYEEVAEFGVYTSTDTQFKNKLFDVRISGYENMTDTEINTELKTKAVAIQKAQIKTQQEESVEMKYTKDDVVNITLTDDDIG